MFPCSGYYKAFVTLVVDLDISSEGIFYNSIFTGSIM